VNERLRLLLYRLTIAASVYAVLLDRVGCKHKQYPVDHRIAEDLP
jgi:hypothetical protein